MVRYKVASLQQLRHNIALLPMKELIGGGGGGGGNRGGRKVIYSSVFTIHGDYRVDNFSMYDENG